MASLPAANKERVLTQKYFALYNLGIEAWSEIRRTGHPLFLIKKGEVTWSGTVRGAAVLYVFNPEVGNEIPSRLVLYPLKEQSTNSSNYQGALANQGDDIINTKIWWNKYAAYC